MFTLIGTAFIFSCNKADDIVSETQQNNMSQEDGVKFEPFFDLAKGDTISKGIFRDKPLFDQNVQILFSTKDNPLETESLLRASGQSSGGGFIYNLMTSVRDKNDAPATIFSDSRYYYQIPVDLNEGAGGKFIFLYYTKSTPSDIIGDGFTAFQVHATCCLPVLSPTSSWIALGKSFGSGGWTDLNEGAGGYYVYLEGLKVGSPAATILYPNPSIITNILIISSTSSLSYYPGWNLVPDDLNRGAGGKYIYLCYELVRI